ncbi:MAG: hypothetical protein AcusKO_21760 [Acuticoccus sp.]
MAAAALASELNTVHLSVADIDAIVALHRETIAALPNPGAVRPDAPAFFEGIFACGGEITGLHEAGSLVAYGVLRPELVQEHDRWALDALVPPTAALWVLDGSAVRPSHWRRGLQRHIVGLRITRAASLGIGSVIAKASPGNVPSMRNLLKSGFATIGLIRKSYGWRYIHFRPTACGYTEPATGDWIAAAGIEEAQHRFEAGEVASACAVTPDGTPILKFARPEGPAA